MISKIIEVHPFMHLIAGLNHYGRRMATHCPPCLTDSLSTFSNIYLYYIIITQHLLRAITN